MHVMLMLAVAIQIIIPAQNALTAGGNVDNSIISFFDITFLSLKEQVCSFCDVHFRIDEF